MRRPRPERVPTISPEVWRELLAGRVELVAEEPGPPGFRVVRVAGEGSPALLEPRRRAREGRDGPEPGSPRSGGF